MIWMSPTATPRSSSRARAAWMSPTTNCKPLSEPGRMSGATVPSRDDDRAARPGRRELNDPAVLADLDVVVHVKAELLGIERLRTVHIRDRDPHHFQRPIHAVSPLSS